MLKQELLEEYRSRHGGFEALGQAMRARLEAELARGGLEGFHVHYRVKAPESLAQKVARPDKTYERLEDVTDLVGLRVITYFEDTIEQVARRVEASFRVDVDRSVDKRKLQEPSSFGYSSLHYICRPPEELLEGHPEWDWPFEIQIRTILQHAWAEMEHDLGYKSPEAVPRPVRRRFSRLAGLLEIADHEFVELRRTMRTYAQQLQQPAGLELGNAELDTLLLGSPVQAAPVRELDEALANHLGMPREETPFYPDYVVRMLSCVELRRPASILRRLESFSPRMRSFAERYFRFTRETWGFDSKKIGSVRRGYCLVLLAHWQALSESELELHRVERMTDFYRQVDYPDDVQEARRIARLFVRDFADWREDS